MGNWIKCLGPWTVEREREGPSAMEVERERRDEELSQKQEFTVRITGNYPKCDLILGYVGWGFI